MSCNSCSSDINSVPKGCKSNGSCGTGDCEKLSVFDWLANMALPAGQEPMNIVEVRFKNGRKHFYKNTENLQISIGDIIAVEGNPGHDIGTVSLTGELIKVQLKRKGIAADSEEIKKIYRKATQKDIDIWNAARDKEYDTQYKGREILGKLGLKMKLSDVEYQGDGNKATFYYTADDRVDFRQLIRDFASTFNIRIEMKQVGLRQEAARLGGVGSCGRELCCSTWLTDLRKVNTTAARYQQLSLNPQKLAGQCGKLKCCLNYELDTYVDALKEFPKQDTILKTEKGDAVFVKMDIFKGLLWYTYKENRAKWYKLTLEQVQEIISANKKREIVASLEEYESEIVEAQKAEYEDVVGQDSLTRFDIPKSRKKRKNKNKKQQNTDINKPNNTAKNQEAQTQKQQNQGQQKKIKQKANFNKKPTDQVTGNQNSEGINSNKPKQKKQPIRKKGNGQQTQKAQQNAENKDVTVQNTTNSKPKNKNRNKKRRPPKKDANNSENV
ncbi:PSP1 domain-containing protein [Lutibacter maritimus]|uniref:Cell fate regulator YaaT, PSP1 superfamily (Controls sporulation, competence, biofilm development) n=1 Tax=Lutibacter maritimus TaxID=593133 RepID=A0A1I6PK05_9FLAO|nr:regulatory iron-sulfur-containing complex subunit RicT [Lutibacter maritimus]SFS40509.1 Cell fate regulator YaaT, PSP1 superfamily (controls sporulation, competence, biofilm development) [Lutibacter maritimus]